MAHRRAPAPRFNLRRAGLLLGLVLVAYLYYHPLRAYLDTKHQLSERAAQVQSLRSQNSTLERRLTAASSPAALAREARTELSLVKPGEQLYIVKGIAAWRRTHYPSH